MIEYVIFDLDGTLLNTTDGVIESINFTANKMRLGKLDYKTMLNFIGPPIQESFKKYYQCDEEQAQKAANIFREYYKTEALLKAQPYDGIYELCNQLIKSGKKLAVATYKREDYALKLLKHFGFDQYCNSIHGGDNFNLLKKSDIIKMCIDELGGKKENSVLVGDSNNDAIGAQKLSIPFIAVTYGFGFRKISEVYQYEHIGIAKKPIEILSFIDFNME